MQAQSRPHHSVLSLIRQLASAGSYRLATINNESRDLNRYRIDTFRAIHVTDLRGLAKQLLSAGVEVPASGPVSASMCTPYGSG